MGTPAQKRLLRDLKKLQEDPSAGIESPFIKTQFLKGITAAPDETNFMHWQACIFGPDDTPWEGGAFRLTMQFSEEYPNKPPVVKFVTKIFHPNVYNDGAICIDILQSQWSSIYDVSAILTSIQSLLCDPNPSSPANSEAAKLYQTDRKEYIRRSLILILQWENKGKRNC